MKKEVKKVLHIALCSLGYAASVEYRGVKYAELGDKSQIASLPRQNNTYAEKLMNELDNRPVSVDARQGNS